MGGVVKEYQVVIDPQRLAQYGISLAEVKSALDASNQEAGGSSIELAEAEYMVRRQRLSAKRSTTLITSF